MENGEMTAMTDKMNGLAGKGTANTALGLGIAGTALGLGSMGLFGLGGNRQSMMNPQMSPFVTTCHLFL